MRIQVLTAQHLGLNFEPPILALKCDDAPSEPHRVKAKRPNDRSHEVYRPVDDDSGNHGHNLTSSQIINANEIIKAVIPPRT